LQVMSWGFYAGARGTLGFPTQAFRNLYMLAGNNREDKEEEDEAAVAELVANVDGVKVQNAKIFFAVKGSISSNQKVIFLDQKQ
jgi:hypothetical protein